MGTVSHAQIVPFDYTGNEVAHPNDTNLLGNVYQNLGLGGEVGNDFITEKGYEFTVDQETLMSYLVVNADVTGENNINVSFTLFQDTKPLFMGEGSAPYYGLPTTPAYSFLNGQYSDFEIPFSAELDPNTDYWIMAEDPQYSGSTFNYQTSYIDPPIQTATAPELPTWVLLATGLLIMMFGFNQLRLNE